MASFSWGTSNNNNNNNNNKFNNTSTGLSWGNNGNNNNNNNNNATNNNATNNNATNNNTSNNTSFGSWGNNTNTNNNSTNNNNNSTNNNNTSSWGWGNNNNNNNQNNQNNNQNNNNQNNNNQKQGETNWLNNTNNNNTNNNNNNNNSNLWGNNNNNNNNNNVLNPNNDHVVSDIASDAISCIKFHPSQPHFIVSSWDNTISYYEFFGNNQTKKLGSQKHDKPILNCCFGAGQSQDHVFSVGCDNNIKQWIPQRNNEFTTIGSHNAPIRCVQYNDNANLLITASWDKCMAFWDLRQQQNNNNNNKPVFNQNLGAKIYAMATQSNYLVVALSDNDIQSFDLRNGAQQLHSTKKEAVSNSKAVMLKKQVRCVDIFPNSAGYVAASIGGRVIIKHFDRSQNVSKGDFSYKCHRQSANQNNNNNSRNNTNQNIFGVNVIKFHGQSSVFATGGDDGEIVTWDKDGRAKLHTFKSMKIQNYNNNSGNTNAHIDNSRMPIVGLDYHKNGQYMLYATSYNWNKGLEFNDTQQQKPQVYLHQINNVELDKNKKK